MGAGDVGIGGERPRGEFICLPDGIFRIVALRDDDRVNRGKCR